MTRLFTLFFGLIMTFYGASFARAQSGVAFAPNVDGRYASIAVDADSREILHARQIDTLRYPASLTKMMTLYLAFDAIDAGTLTLDDELTISARAASQPPVKLGLRKGQKLRVHDAVQALAVKSSNDVAVALAEHIGGSEENFARMMTQKARDLGMDATTYRNASGLPEPWQVTTARDQAKLADQILRTHRRHYHYFGQHTFKWKGRTLRNHNTLLGRIEGVDGFKTGYTNASGYNLTISAQRGGRRIIAVVLGGASGKSRDQHMAELIDRAFDVIGQTPTLIGQNQSTKPRLIAASTPRHLQAFTLRGKNKAPLRVATGAQASAITALPMTKKWSLALGQFDSPRQAQDAVNAALIKLPKAQYSPDIRKSNAGFQARLTELDAQTAQQGCKALKTARQFCMVIAPSG